MSLAAAQNTDVTDSGVFGQTMGLVAATLGFLTLGAYLGRHLGGGPSLVTCCATRAGRTRRSFGSQASRSPLSGTPRSSTTSWSSTPCRTTQAAIAATAQASGYLRRALGLAAR